ncbi:MAG: SUMF1/EgtB/PvdO family nonheme iron enzyme [Solobacterium sp.]|nr:SUMF1/EgtB/PvdO family nonheme iron enzyme [Solobacterium sp.]
MTAQKNRSSVKRIVDICLMVLLLCQMAYQVTGEQAHEYSGMIMTAVVIIHQILNRKWYGTLFKGRYNAYRTLTASVNALLLVSFVLTAFCGMSMSTYAVPFMYGIAKVSFVRRMHLSMSHWAFVFMGIHLGMHLPVMAAQMRLSEQTKKLITYAFCIIAGLGLYLFLHNGVQNYLFFRVPFAFLDYEKAGILVFLENLAILLFFAFLGDRAALLCRKQRSQNYNSLMHIVLPAVSVVLGLVLNMIFPAENLPDFAGGDWREPAAAVQESTPAADEPEGGDASEAAAAQQVDDGFLYIEGGTFLMGSPESENWRIEDETQHEVRVSSFCADAYETTQSEYERLMGENPSAFSGADLPVENITWLDAIRYANAKSLDAGLTPAYQITGEEVIWDMSAEEYRLPSEAEWEYLCRAGTVTPFNTEKSLDASEANFYGHYPYEIEENYFNNSVLEAKPGEYRQTTVPVGSFEANAWGLYDCHGNVNEWCWDYYGAYDAAASADPTGAESGTRHVYRGGGWNDFAKNMRSAYRAAGQADMASFNLGVRLVRNAAERSGIAKAEETVPDMHSGGNVLIAYFSWGGNTRGVAQEIQRQTSADLFEITLVHPYSADYNTVLMEAQEDQHRQARPEIAEHIENMEDYGIILLGYPNWWASIPMPVASFLEEYDFAGKQIIPFCSHGGGRFGQSLTAIAKLAPEAVIGEGLSVHYSGGSSLPDDVSAWLETNGIEK